MVEQSSTHFCLNWRKSGWTRWIRPALLGRKTSQVQANISEMADRLKVDLQKRLCKFHAVAKNHVELGLGFNWNDFEAQLRRTPRVAPSRSTNTRQRSAL